MKIVLVHNFYQQPGGEDTVFASESTLLRQNGHEVVEYIEDNHHINKMSRFNVAAQTIWSHRSRQKMLRFLRDTQCDIAHFHNTFLLISPSAYYACREAGVPVIQALDNLRLFCPAATFYRDGQICEDCLGKMLPWPGILHSCYRGSRAQTSVVVAMLAIHRWLKTWEKQVDIYIASTEFYRQKFIEGGLPAEKLVVKPHFVNPDPGFKTGGSGNYALFIGRLDPEKGVRTLLRAWQLVKGIPLKIRGDGRLLKEVQDFIKKNHLGSIEIVNYLSKEELNLLIKGARFLVWPSEGHYETFGLVAIEAFACGIPVIASRTGVMSTIVEDGRTGLHFTTGDPRDLATKAEWAWNHTLTIAKMGQEARREYEAEYSADRNYEMLMKIYDRAMRDRK